jgi:septum formation protein
MPFLSKRFPFDRTRQMNCNIQQADLILASKSPRRRYLLKQAGLIFNVIPSSFDESSVSLTTPRDYVLTLSRSKAEDVAGRHRSQWIIGADTVVFVNDRVLGKPVNPSAARDMLRQLSGRTHQVYTGYTICCLEKEKCHSDVVCTDVTFKHLSADEIEWYIRTDEPFDKAGAYAIQGLGTFLVKQINGSYTNVVGLPVCEVIEYLIQEHVIRLNVTDHG